MKRTIASLAVLAILATGAWAQTSDPYSNTTNNNATTKTSTPGTSTTNADVIDNTNTTNTTTTDANTTTDATMNTTTDSNNDNLPATASPLPLLSLSGIGMIASGVWLMRRRRNA